MYQDPEVTPGDSRRQMYKEETLSPEAALEAKTRLVEEFDLDPTAAQFDLVEAIEASGDGIPSSEFNLFQASGNLELALERIDSDLPKDMHVLVAWDKDDSVQATSFAKVVESFPEEWKAGNKEAVIFDESGKWYIAINSEGVVSYHLPKEHIPKSVGAAHVELLSDSELAPLPSLRLVRDEIIEPETIHVRGIPFKLLTDVPSWQVEQWLPHDLEAEEIVVFPDACPSSGPLPTGTAVRTFSPNWRKLALSDCGCGMQLLKSGIKWDDFSEKAWDQVGLELRKNAGGLGDLGGGNHFVDALVNYRTDEIYFLVHTGSRRESGLVDQLVDKPGEFEDEFERIVRWARDNRDTVASTISRVMGQAELIWDKPHNTFEKQSDGSVIIRKGVVKCEPGDKLVLPSSMTGDVALLEAEPGVEFLLSSLSHGTGRQLSRSDAKKLVLDASELREKIYIPSYIKDTSLRTEAPECYRPLDRCLELIGPRVTELDRFRVIAYLGRL